MVRIKIGEHFVHFRGKVGVMLKTLSWRRREEGFRDFTEFDRWLKRYGSSKGDL